MTVGPGDLESGPAEATIHRMTPSAPAQAATRGAAWKIVLSVFVVRCAVGFLLTRSMREGAE